MTHDRSADINIMEPSIRRAPHHMHDEDGALTTRCVRCAVAAPPISISIQELPRGPSSD